jgi:N-acetylglucosaminyl-diphospho-decaprenol L-rhamnosyltransferase
MVADAGIEPGSCVTLGPRPALSGALAVSGPVPVELSYCVVNTEHRQLLSYCLDAIARERATVDFETETLVLDNASRDGSAEAARAHAVTTDVIERDRRHGRGDNATELMRRARGRYCLLLNEDSELEPGATVALHAALDAYPDAGAAGATLVSPDGEQQPSAWRFPSAWTGLLSLVGLRNRLVVQSRGTRVRDVDWAPAAALLVRREAAAGVGWLEGDEVAFCRRLRTSGRRVLYVPEARAVAHDHM